MSTISSNSSLDVLRTRAEQLKLLRVGLMQQFFFPAPVDAKDRTLNDIANSFSRFAAYQQTAFDNGSARSNGTSATSSLERQVQRAINQVLGRAPGRGGGSFMNALNGAFPTTGTPEGQQVTSTPARSMVSMYGEEGSGGGSYSANGFGKLPGSDNGYAGTISARQANLLRQASVMAGDAIRVLDGLTPFAPEAELDQVDALRALIRSEINSLIDEFGRVDEPRKDRVLAYFSALKLHVTGFGERAFLDDPTRAATVDDEAQVAGLELLKSYRNNLRSVWNTFYNVDRKSPTSFSLSERIERAGILLPVIAQVNDDFEAAMDSVGFTESERRSQDAKFNTLAGFDVPLPLSSQFFSRFTFGRDPKNDIDAALPDITVYDLNDWIDRFANLEGPSNLSDSGLYGLDFVTDQADRIFWVIAPIVAHLERGQSASPLASPSLEQILSNDRVRFALNNLFGQLDALADQSVPGANSTSH
jgi:hypothetical protein